MKKPVAAKLSSQYEEDYRSGRRRHRAKSGPDSAWGWFVVFNSFVCNMIVDGMQYTFANFLIPITLSMESTVPEVSLIGSLLSGFYNFAGPIAGALGNKFGFRMVVITGSLVSSAGLTLSYFAPNVHFLYFFYGVFGGLGFGMIYMASVITTSIYFDKYRALAVSISVCGTGVGTFMFAPLGNYLVYTYGWRWALVTEGGIILVCILCGLSFRPVELLKMVPLSAEASEAVAGTARGSIYYSTERRKTLPNEAYPTLKEAIIYQDKDERRSTIVSLVIRSQMPSDTSSDSSLSIMEQNDLLGRPRTRKQKCYRCFRVFCFNFWHCRCQKRELTLGDRPMYRDDVFYGSNLSNLKSYSTSERINYHLSVTRIPDRREVAEHMGQKCCVCHHAFLRTCATMTGVGLLKSRIFAFMCLSSFLYTMGLYIPYVFIKELGVEHDISGRSAVWLVSAIGISNTAGRLASGILKSLVKINSAILVLACLIVSGVFSFVFLFCSNLGCLVTFSCVFGFFTAPFISLRPVIIVDFLGLEKLTNAFGLVLLSQGVASILGPPIAGLIVKKSSKYDYVMYMAGTLMILSASALLTSAILKKKKNSATGNK